MREAKQSEERKVALIASLGGGRPWLSALNVKASR